MVVTMYQQIYDTWEGSQAAFVDCNVDPVPESIVWKTSKRAPPKKRIPVDNRKYYYGPTAPTLVIRNPNKAMDEAIYQCTAGAKGNEVEGDIVELHVSETDMSRTTTNISGSSGDLPQSSQPSVPEFQLAQQTQEADKENESSEHSQAREPRFGKLIPVRKRRGSDVDDQSQPGSKRPQAPIRRGDQGSRLTFQTENDVDMARQESEKDISDTFTRATGRKRVRQAKLKKKCIQVCIDITGAEYPSEPSSVHLAEEFKHYLLDGGKIYLSDESHTMLQVDETSFDITPQNVSEDGFPFVISSHGIFNVHVGKTAIIQTYAIASNEVTSIQWFKIEDGDHIPIEIDNKRYLGGSVPSPTLIIREANIDDKGEYFCSATNSNGTGWSDVLVLSVRSGETGALADIKRSPTVRVKGQSTCIKHDGCELDLYCDNCNVPICTKCLSTEEHRNHTVSKLDDITHRKKRDIQNFIEKTENFELEKIKQDITSTDSELKENASNFDNISQQIKDQTNKLKEELELQSAQTLSHYKEIEENNAKKLKLYKQDLEMHNKQLNQKVQECKEAIQSGSKLDIYDVGCDIHVPIPPPIKPNLVTTEFRKEDLTKKLLEKTFEVVTSELPPLSGHYRSLSTTSEQSSSTEKEDGSHSVDAPLPETKMLKANAPLPETKMLKEGQFPVFIDSIYPINDGQLWTSDMNSATLTLLDRSGKVLQEVTHNNWITDISLGPSTNTLWACDMEHNITELMSGRLVHRFNTREESRCVCITDSNHVIVGMEGKISKFTTKGELVLTSGSTETGIPLVGRPHRMSECPVTQNLAVVDLNSFHVDGVRKKCVVAMDSAFNKLFEYNGEVYDTDRSISLSGDKPFEPLSVVYDRLGNLVIGDNNNRVLLISGRGEFLRILHTDKSLNKGVVAAAVDKRNVLWAVFGAVKVKQLRYYSV